ncbi:MAG: hypothetical protein ACK417_01315 [Bacteroidia bacterium]
MRLYPAFLFCVCVWVLTLSSCREDRFEPNADIELRFETDSLLFDTVFTTVGSITKRFKVFNPTNRNLLIDEVFLGGRRLSGNSAYRLNINGIASNDVKGVELLANDSLYIFVEVTIDPNSANTPFIVSDSVVFRSGSRLGKVYLEAFGQNAIFYNSQVLPCNMVWTADKPIVVYNSVLVDSLCKLTIEAGTRIFFNKNSSLFVLGTLEVNGTETNPVTFRGDRLDPFYRDLAGAWNGIHFLVGSVNNLISNAELFNGNVGVRADSLPVSGTAPNVVLNKVIIDNFAIVGLLGFTARITADNTMVTNCGLYNFLGDFGGDYRFRHCTFANFSTGFSRSFPLFALSNRNLNNQANGANLELRNSIVWGTRQEEFVLDTAGTGGFDAQLSHSILRTQRNPSPGGSLIFENPRFREPADKDFRIDTLSPAFGAGQNLVPQYPQLATDLFGQQRSITPTLGAIERIE